MDWNSIRVLATNLQALLDEIQTGSNTTGKGSVRESWRLGIIAIPKQLAIELGYPEVNEQIHSSHLSVPSNQHEGQLPNPYLSRAYAVSEIANKLIADYDKLSQSAKA